MDFQGESSKSSKFFYDVFLSFSGKDTRQTFIGHLYERLHRDGINTFKDDKSLRVGDVISTALEKAIEDSRVSIVILSTKYASSRWCLDELVKILECKNRLKQRVMPVFYHVLPTDVRKQTGEFGKEFDKLKERFEDQTMEKWAAALNEVASLSGSELRVVTNGDEAEFIGKIIKDVKKEVNHTPLCVASYPVGIDSRAKDVELLLQKGSEDEVRVVGIYGLGGIGKTTLAKYIYNRLSRVVDFDASCFLPNVRSQEEKIGLEKVQEKLLNMLFRTEEFKVYSVAEGMNLIKRKLERKKVLIVLDDVDTKEQLESLTKEKEWFGSGSIIVITTRDERLVRGFEANERYKAKLLNENESQQLFYHHAFDSLPPSQEYVGVAQDIIKYSGGLPLALVILGSHFREAPSIKEWRTEFKKLEEIPHDDIQKILKISFDGLPHDTKTVFLDIACAFHGLYEYEVTRILNACRFHTESEISTLVQKHLLQKEEKLFTQIQFLFMHDPVQDMGPNLVMHDLVRDMGREIVRSESAQYPGGRSRLFIPEEICDVLLGHNGSGNVEVLTLDRPGELDGVELSTKAFKKMNKLRVLTINELRIDGDFGLFPRALKWLSWQKCPLKCIPSTFPATSLVVLDMSWSDIEEFNLNLQCCPRLKELNLSYCAQLRKTPNFKGARSLETLLLKSCYHVTEIDQSICQLNSLQVLDITECCIRELPIGLGDMQNLTSLCANDTDLQQLPEFVEKLNNLTILQVGNLELYSNEGRVIKSLSNSLSCLAIRNYGMSEAAFGADVGSLSSLTSLDLSGNSFRYLPFDFSKLRLLKELHFNDCENLQTLPSLSNLENLQTLKLSNCKKLVDITGLDNLVSIREIDMIDCNSLQNPPFNEDFFRAHALSSIKHPYQLLQIISPSNEIPDWCSNKTTAPSICFTMPTVDNKFLGMVLWLVFNFKGIPLANLVVDVSSRDRASNTSSSFYINLISDHHEEQSRVYYISCSNNLFGSSMIKGGEEIIVHEKYFNIAKVKKIGIHLLYSDQYGNLTSLPAIVDHQSYKRPKF